MGDFFQPTCGRHVGDPLVEPGWESRARRVGGLARVVGRFVSWGHKGRKSRVTHMARTTRHSEHTIRSHGASN